MHIVKNDIYIYWNQHLRVYIVPLKLGLKLHQRRPQTVAEIAHERMVFRFRFAGWIRKPETRGGRSIPDQPGDKVEYNEYKLGDKPKEMDTPSQISWNTSEETKTRETELTGGHSIPDELEDKMGDKLRNKTGDKLGWDKQRMQLEDKRKTNPARRTEHPKQGGHNIQKALRTPTVNCFVVKTWL